MPEFLRQLFSSGDFMPHGYCYLWNPGLVWLHVISDGLITASYFVIPFTLLKIVRKRRDIPFHWMFVCFGVFIVACGATHAMEIWNLWHADYWLSGIIKAITAAASVPTAILLVRLIPQAVSLPSTRDMQQATEQLRQQTELLDLAHDAIFVRDSQGLITYWNGGAEKLYRWTSEQACGKVSHELLRTRFPQPRDEIETQVLDSGGWEGELVHQKFDGQPVTVASRWSVRRGSTAEAFSILEINRDITNRKIAEQKFGSLLEAAPDAMVIVNRQGCIVLTNMQTEKLFGYPSKELAGQPVEMLMPEALRHKHESHRDGFFQSPRTRAMGAGLELAGRRKDGSEFPIEISLSPLRTEDDTLVISTIRDVTERRRAETLLREREERFRDLFVKIPHPVWVYDLETLQFLEVNETAIRQYGYSREEFLSKRIVDIRSREDAELLTKNLAPVREELEYSGEWRHLAKDGRIIDVEVSSHVLNFQGRHAALVFALDITRRKEAERKIQKLNLDLSSRAAELAETNRDLESFSYSVSHDLRAPLRHMDGFARILAEESGAQLDESGQHYLDRIMQGAQQMGELVDDLLNLSRVGRQEMSYRKTNLDRVVRAAIAEISSSATGRKIEWKLAALPAADCDAGLMKIAFTNLLSNAIKFTGRQPLAVIEVGCQEDASGEPVIFVRDNGVGFDSRYADKLFGVFQRLHRQEDFEGTGIGLATVKRIIQKHGGRIWAESQPGVGTTLYFTITGLPKPVGAIAAGKEDTA